MYINPFVAGVLATIMVELIIVIGLAIFNNNKIKEDK
jgi:hypothetical protein